LLCHLRSRHRLIPEPPHRCIVDPD
jgi:hypothetical protein